jgi:hypothetical protein
VLVAWSDPSEFPGLAGEVAGCRCRKLDRPLQPGPSVDERPPRSAVAEAAQGQFLRDNPGYLNLTSACVSSYWACYYRGNYPNTSKPSRIDYPGFQLIKTFLAVASDATPIAEG